MKKQDENKDGTMNKKPLIDYLNKKVFIVLRNERNYSGTVTEIDYNGPGLIFLTILDKFNKKVCFAISEIIIIQEEE